MTTMRLRIKEAGERNQGNTSEKLGAYLLISGMNLSFYFIINSVVNLDYFS